MSLVEKEAANGLFVLALQTAVFSVIRRGERLKMAAASPRCWGRGAVSYFAVAPCEASPQPSWAGGLGSQPEAQNGGGAERRGDAGTAYGGPRLAEPRGARGDVLRV